MVARPTISILVKLVSEQNSLLVAMFHQLLYAVMIHPVGSSISRVCVCLGTTIYNAYNICKNDLQRAPSGLPDCKL